MLCDRFGSCEALPLPSCLQGVLLPSGFPGHSLLPQRHCTLRPPAQAGFDRHQPLTQVAPTAAACRPCLPPVPPAAPQERAMVATRAATNGQAEIKRVPLFRVSTQVRAAQWPFPAL